MKCHEIDEIVDQIVSKIYTLYIIETTQRDIYKSPVKILLPYLPYLPLYVIQNKLWHIRYPYFNQILVSLEACFSLLNLLSIKSLRSDQRQTLSLFTNESDTYLKP